MINRNMKTDSKLLALDIDGTLLTKEKKLTERTKSALSAAMKKGLTAVLVTGRPLSGLPEELLAFSDIRYVITSNGAITFDMQNRTAIRKALIDPLLAEQIARIPYEEELLFNVFIDGIGYCEQSVYDTMLRLFDGTPTGHYVRMSRRPADNLKEVIGASDGVENIWLRAKDRAQRDRLNEIICSSRMLKTVLTAETDVETGAFDADKGLALSALAKQLEVPQNAILAIGDNENDIGMFQAAGISIAMGNASSFVKQHADYITATNNEDGAAEAIERFCLI